MIAACNFVSNIFKYTKYYKCYNLFIIYDKKILDCFSRLLRQCIIFSKYYKNGGITFIFKSILVLYIVNRSVSYCYKTMSCKTCLLY